MEVRQDKDFDGKELVKWLEDSTKFDGYQSRTRPAYAVENSRYYFEEGSNLQLLVIEGTEYYWSEPVCGLRNRELDSCGSSTNVQLDREYLKRVYESVQTLEQYHNVLNLGYLMLIGVTPEGNGMACCDFIGISRGMLKSFFLYLGGKRFQTREVQLHKEFYTRMCRTELGEYRHQCVKRLDRVQTNLSHQTMSKKTCEFYEAKVNVDSYYTTTVLGRLNDAVAVMTNLQETEIVIPGDGFGVFSRVAQIFGKQVVSGESSLLMVSVAGELGTSLVREDGISTVQRGISKFGSNVLVFISFLWAVAPEIYRYCIQHGYRVLVYDTYLYYPLSSTLAEYSSQYLRGNIGIKWYGSAISLSEKLRETGHKPMLTQLVRGPLFIDSVKAVRQMAIYSEMYPDAIQISKRSLIKTEELVEMSYFHKFRVVDSRPVVWLIRCPHHRPDSGGVVFDLDNWSSLSDEIQINKMIIGHVPERLIKEYFPLADLRVEKPQPKSMRTKRKKPRKIPMIVEGSKVIGLQTVRFVQGNKYYMASRSVLRPFVAPLFDDGEVKLVWLQKLAYVYEYSDMPHKFVSYHLNAG